MRDDEDTICIDAMRARIDGIRHAQGYALACMRSCLEMYDEVQGVTEMHFTLS